MAELGVAASVLGIVSFALNLSKKLYQFTATTSAAGEEVGYIAKNVTNFADALELLAERLDEDNEPMYSKHTVKVVANLYDQSCDLFDKIEDLIPEPKNGRDELNFVQKVAWNFKKARVEFLAGQIECLKTTASLVATVLFAGKKIRSQRSSRRRKRKTVSDRTNLDQVRQRVTIAVVEQQQASSRLSDLQEKAVAEDRLALQADNSATGQTDAECLAEQMSLVSLNDTSHVIQLHKVVEVGEAGCKQIILQENDDLLLHLVERFTTLETGEEDYTALRSELHVRAQRDTGSYDRAIHPPSQEKLFDDPAPDADRPYQASEEARRTTQMPPRPTSKSTSSHSHGDSKYQHTQASTPLNRPGGLKAPHKSGKTVIPSRADLTERKKQKSRTKNAVFNTSTKKVANKSGDNNRSKRKRETPDPSISPRYAAANHNPIEERAPRYTSLNDAKHAENDIEIAQELFAPVDRYGFTTHHYYYTDDDDSMKQISQLQSRLLRKWRPEYINFIERPPSDLALRDKERRRLTESVMKEIVEVADAIELQGDAKARAARKCVLANAFVILRRLDSTAGV